MTPRILLVTDSIGGLGNQLFRFAHLAAHAASTGATLVHPGFTHAREFPALRGDPLCRFPPRHAGGAARPRMRPAAAAIVRAIGRAPGRKVVAEEHPIDLGRDPAGRALALLSGWGLRDPTALTAHAAAVRRALTLDSRHLAAGRAAVAAARRQGGLVIGVHVRQGDYSVWQGGRWHYEDAQYAELMRRTLAAFPASDVAFVVCASEPRPRPAFKGLPVQQGPGDPYGDLAALAACDRILGPPSTFSSWAAFSGGVPYGYVLDPAAAITPASFAPWSAS